MPTTDSDPAEATLALTGVWLHDPADAEGTAINLPYSGGSRDHSVDAGGVATAYAGRTYPVVEYGEHAEEQVSLTVAVPHGPTYTADLATLDVFVRAKITLWYRDNRGRSLPATIASHKVSDAPWGAAVALTLARVDYAVEEVAA